MEDRLSTKIHLSVILLLIFLTTFINGYKTCYSTGFDSDRTCSDSQYCCGVSKNQCCDYSFLTYNSGSDLFAAFVFMAVLIGCPICCCWWCCCRKERSPGVIYNPVEAVQTAGTNQLASQRTGGVPSTNMSQPNPYSQQAPYPIQQAPYPVQPMNYPQQVPYPIHPSLYPPHQAPYPPVTPATHPSNAAPYPTNMAPYPPISAPYPAQHQQVLSTSNLDNLYPAQEPTNPYFRMPPPAYNESMQQSAPPGEPEHFGTNSHQPPSAPPL